MAGIKEEKKIYLVGIYCRLSKDDGTDNESASIATQKSILTDYVKKQGWHIAKTYVDDGYSGTNFQRPSFQNMIKDIESGLINCVITKDLSRLGRNYLDCGLYLEVFFPEHNVRYIAVNDGVDTLNKSALVCFREPLFYGPDRLFIIHCHIRKTVDVGKNGIE